MGLPDEILDGTVTEGVSLREKIAETLALCESILSDLEKEEESDAGTST